MNNDKVLEILNKLNNTTEYKIISVQEVLQNIGGDGIIKDLEATINVLEDEGYIDVKFFDSQNICYKILKFYTDTSEKDEEKTNSTPKMKTPINMLLIIALTAFLGAFLGNLIFWLCFVA